MIKISVREGCPKSSCTSQPYCESKGKVTEGNHATLIAAMEKVAVKLQWNY